MEIDKNNSEKINHCFYDLFYQNQGFKLSHRIGFSLVRTTGKRN
jgi:hypothetical protein